MSTNIAQFNAKISAVLNRGTDFDSEIADETRKAVRFLERTNRFLYMQFSRDIILVPGTKRYILVPGAIRVEAWWHVNSLGQFQYLVGIDPTDPISNTEIEEKSTTLGHYFIDYDPTKLTLLAPTPRANLIFDPTESYLTTILESFTAPWPTSDTSGLWMIEYGEDLLTHQVMMQMGPVVRDPELFALHKPLRDEALLSVIAADEELRRSTQELQMQYGG